MDMLILKIVVGALFSVVGLVLLVTSFFSVGQQTVGVVERFGKFVRIAKTGLNFKLPLIESVAKRLSLAVQQMVVKIETKTKDNVFVTVHVTVQYYVLENKLFEAFYKLSNAKAQIESYVLDTVRGQVPKMDLDHVFENKDEIATAVKQGLSGSMADYGFGFQSALVTEIDPDAKVKEAMNEINAATRLRVAATEKGEAEKVLTVKRAEADAEARRLNGEGIAKQRQAIIHGLKDSCDELGKATGLDASKVMAMILTTQYFDAMQHMATAAGSKVIFANSSPGAAESIREDITKGILATEKIQSGNGVSTPIAAPQSS